MPDLVTHLAPAKLNLALAVGPVGTDGMHPICSWMVTVDLCDELQVTRLAPGSLSHYAIIWHRDAKRRTPIDWSISRDLAVRAHLAMQENIGRDIPVQMKLQKRIPVGGGLGGGSSNAAAMLRAINELYELGLSGDDLVEISRELGSDVAFLVAGGSAVVQGKGDEIEQHATAPELHAVLVFPEFTCETPRVYGIFDELIEGKNHALRQEAVQALAGGGVKAPDQTELFNDLAAPAFQASPRLEGLMEEVSELAERPAHVSGSGSSLFVICDDALHAEALAKAVEDQLDLPAVAVKTHVQCEETILKE